MSVELAAVLITGFVALATILIAPIIRLTADWLTWRRQQKAESLQKVEEVTKILLNKFSGVYAAGRTLGELGPFVAETCSAFLSWERSLWGKSKRDERSQIEALRQTFLSGSIDTYKENFDHIIREILDLSHKVTQRMD